MHYLFECFENITSEGVRYIITSDKTEDFQILTVMGDIEDTERLKEDEKKKQESQSFQSTVNRRSVNNTDKLDSVRVGIDCHRPIFHAKHKLQNRIE